MKNLTEFSRESLAYVNGGVESAILIFNRLEN